jgi:colanic acid/amylovoran biosynthesis glycosyltransferase
MVVPPLANRTDYRPGLLNAVTRRIPYDEVAQKLRLELWRPRILHAHFGARGVESLELKRRLKIPLVTSFYGHDAWQLPEIDPTWRKWYEELFEAGDLFLVEGPAMRDRLSVLGCSDKKVVIHRIGVDMAELPYEAKDFSSELKIAMVGRFVEKKGLIDGLLACGLARSQGIKLSVTIIGDAAADDPSGQQIKAELLALADSPELSGSVRFVGFTPLKQTRSILKEHNIFLGPSKRAVNGDAEGGSPVILTEAMAMGLLCIGARHCDIPEVILDGKTGYLCDSGDATSIAKVICAIDTDRSKLLEVTKAGRNHVEEKFSLTTQLDLMGKIYCQALNKQKK